MSDINIWAVLVSALASFLLGGLWYSPLMFLKPWLKASGQEEADQKPHPPRVFAASFLFALVAAASFAVLLGKEPPLTEALLRGLIIGVCFVGASFGINYQFSGRSMTLWAIDGGYHVAQFAIFGLVLGIWH
ncbi:MAG: DUF1761 domain-containing protein [Planctomycetes bacterium]|nr:DUF1761 domain-containing protein [Planctomycetota bacterium]